MTDAEPVFVDDASIQAADPVWRRIPPGRWTYDHNEGRARPTSDCFKYWRHPETRERHPMSVTLGEGLTPDMALQGQQPGFKLAGWPAGHIRGHQLGVCHDDQPDVVAHGLVFTLQEDSHGVRQQEIPNSVRDRLAKSAAWVIGLSLDEVEEARRRTAAPPPGN